jgi:hypothetical protein
MRRPSESCPPRWPTTPSDWDASSGRRWPEARELRPSIHDPQLSIQNPQLGIQNPQLSLESLQLAGDALSRCPRRATRGRDWNAKLTAFDADDRVLAVANLWHRSPGADTKHLGTLHLSTNEPIARFKVIEQSDNSDRILNLDRLVLETLP